MNDRNDLPCNTGCFTTIQIQDLHDTKEIDWLDVPCFIEDAYAILEFNTLEDEQ